MANATPGERLTCRIGPGERRAATLRGSNTSGRRAHVLPARSHTRGRLPDPQRQFAYDTFVMPVHRNSSVSRAGNDAVTFARVAVRTE